MTVLLVGGLIAAAVVGAVLASAEIDDGDDQDAPVAAHVVGTTVDGWQSLRYHDLRLEVPPQWVRRVSDGCERGAERWASEDVDPCSDDGGLSFYVAATFDPAGPPGVHRAKPSDRMPDGSWAGYVIKNGDAVYAADADRELVRRILRSVRQAT